MTAAVTPCPGCPWLTANHGRRHPDGWYTKANRRRLWAGLRRGEPMSCHPTDPANTVSERARDAGYRPAPEHTQIRECAGALALQQRELGLLTEIGEVRAYRKARPGGLTVDGIARLVERAVLGGVWGTRVLPRADLNAPVSHGGITWSER